MDDFLKNKISPWEFRKKYWHQRHKDLDQDEKKGYTYEKYEENLRNLTKNEKKFEKEYSDLLYEEGSAKLSEYERGAKDLNIKGEIFFMGIWNFLDCPVKDYYPSEDEGFDQRFNLDEQTLTRIVQSAFDVLERNKDRWMNEKQKLDQEELSGENSQGEGT